MAHNPHDMEVMDVHHPGNTTVDGCMKYISEMNQTKLAKAHNLEMSWLSIGRLELLAARSVEGFSSLSHLSLFRE